MRKYLQVTLGVLTAIGGFVDIGDLVANAAVGARFGWSLAWVVVFGVIGIILYAEMSGRVAAITGRATFDVIRERLGPRFALGNLLASFAVTFLTLIAEVAGIALALQLMTSVNYLLFLPTCGLLVWIVIWRVQFDRMERIFGILGLALVVFAVAAWRLGPDWADVVHQATHPHAPSGEGAPTYWYYAIALFGAAMTPYEVFFFSSGAVEEDWDKSDLQTNRANVFVGFPLGGVLSLAIMTCTAVVFAPRGMTVSHLSEVALPVASSLGRIGLAFALIGFFAATFGAALETGLSTGYTVSQYFGWPWGKATKPLDAARFHGVVLVSILVAVAVALTTVDPIKVTEYSIVFSAVALPLTYFPILIVANDPDYLGDDANSRFTNGLATVYLVVIVVAAVAAIPLMLITKAGA
ncbi:NRAMP family divalent metal transporter [Aquihabitans sp. McL0605]|uniref:NRAMP family divalent metal transporter n=1 Tax=Aquihabitans sp. McL0605 TaxID=3415671 RepID=UPI003CF042D2